MSEVVDPGFARRSLAVAQGKRRGEQILSAGVAASDD